MSTDKEKQKQMQDFLNRKRKLDMNVADDSKLQNPSTSSEKKSEESVEKDKRQEQYEKAKKALLFDAKRAKERAELVGPQGYLKPKSLSTNKQFLKRIIESTVPRRKNKEQPPE
uniref:Uncharacterized protein n=2 Tax=Caenorhabditis japonica TaxID=281687 RepID=A0A8R1HQI3_CAEJA